MRQIRLLKEGYELTVMGYGACPSEGINYIQLSEPARNFARRGLFAIKLALGLFNNYYWGMPQVRQTASRLANTNFDLMLANDLSALPLALKFKGNGKVLLDAHEYSPREFEDQWIWKLFFTKYYDFLCKKYLKQTDVMTTVCQGIAEEYTRQYGVTVDVVYNAPAKIDLQPSEVDPYVIRMVHHGLAIQSRHLELTIELMALLDDRFTLDLMLVSNDPKYMAKLRSLAANNPRIRFIPPVDMNQICTTINKYDIGLFLLPPVNFNYEYALPNKFFEFIQARLAIAIGPSPEMARLIEQHSCGIVASSFNPKDLADHLDLLTPQKIREMKYAAGKAAEELNYSNSGQNMLQKIESLIGS